MFYSAQLSGFYNVEDHGPRKISIVDPAWIRPTVNIVLQPGESAWDGENLVENTDDEPLTLRNVPDANAVPDMLTVDNPACLIPIDAVEITKAQRDELLAGESTGLVISSDKYGYPVLVDPPAPDAAVLEAIERAWRDAQLASTDPLVSRHRDEVEEGGSTTLAADQYIELQAYRRQLRDWPQGEQFPLAEHRPPAPPWLAEQST